MDTPSPITASMNVALGGAIGAVLRYQLGRVMTQWLGPDAVTAFPFATLAANTIGSLLMGVLAGVLVKNGGEAQWSEQLRLFVGVGLLGGFTTFSAFSLEMVLLIERGNFLFAALYVMLSVALGIVGLFVGLNFVRLFN
ncbi:fluoride efflux transporter CrcB [Paraurantiacibacter namhicola]|uniref:Fluoride-specific ion channel FluC n=1 Tax=Paraurantiacibacter namhicola TaxID=645517 RepID=A0A1C7DAZ9_9SPHN|nr:fluoride efflux transporter CrcB [Paraurantiacibacter namhicola]ANU08624.1 Putative fluoride ion transporter CrcB [Paraurantiacibacter namhicola]